MKKIKTIKYSNSALSKLVIFPNKKMNKYSRGTCNIIAGSEKYPGAAILACKAATRSGSGYTKLFTHKANYKYIATAIPDIPTSTFNDIKLYDQSDDKPCAYLVGPGFDPDKDNASILEKVLKETSAPVVIDGGALSSISKTSIKDLLDSRNKKNYTTILTPHAGEGKKILSYYAVEPEKKLKEQAKQIVNHTKTTVVLKDSITYICDTSKIYEMKSGTPALAKAGSGDVLAGILAAVLCQNKINSFDACVLSTNIHAKAAKLASKDLSTISVTPLNLIEYLPKSIQLIA